jgi:branched-chain amino acid aminotransferase
MLQFYPTSLANAAGFQQVIWTDTYKIGRSWYNECVFQNKRYFTAPTSEKSLMVLPESLIDLAEKVSLFQRQF